MTKTYNRNITICKPEFGKYNYYMKELFLSQLEDLTLAEKIQLVEEIWDDIAADPGKVSVPEWHKVELDRRKKQLQNNPGSLSSWEDVRSRIRKRDV